MNTITMLKNLQKQGLLFHGSPHSLSVIEPRPGRDQTSDIGRQTAVYASNDYRLAVIKAVIKPSASDWSYSWHIESERLRVEGFGVSCGHGYVHVLDPEPFLLLRDSRKEEYVSYFSVRPRFTILVKEETLRALPNCTTHIVSGYYDLHTPPNF